MSCWTLVGAAVRTLDPERPSATAIAVSDGAIAAVGSDAEIRELAGPATEVIDLHGAAVVPGLIDSHMHPFMGALGARGADLLGVFTLDEVRRRVAAERARCAPGEWVLGWGLEYNALAGVEPTARCSTTCSAAPLRCSPTWTSTRRWPHLGLCSSPASPARGRSRSTRRSSAWTSAHRGAARGGGDGDRARGDSRAVGRRALPAVRRAPAAGWPRWASPARMPWTATSPRTTSCASWRPTATW